MGKAKTAVAPERRSQRVKELKAKAPPEVKRATAPKKQGKARKPKTAENGSTKAEESKAETTDAQ